MPQVKKNKTNPYLKKGYVLIEEVESSLHVSISAKIRWHFKKMLRNIRYRDGSVPEYEMTIFVAGGPEIDRKVDEMNRRIARKAEREK